MSTFDDVVHDFFYGPAPTRRARYLYEGCTDLDIIKDPIVEDDTITYKCNGCNAKLESAKPITGESAILVFASLHLIDIDQILVNFS